VSKTFDQLVTSFNDSKANERTQIFRFPDLIFVFGGKVDVTSTSPLSARHVFMDNKGVLGRQFDGQFKMPEDYPEWNTFGGFGNLVDFEILVGSICVSDKPAAL
jgi:hypothetical protein